MRPGAIARRGATLAAATSLAAALMLLFAGSALAANPPAHVTIVGTGDGEVVAYSEVPLGGNPPIDCHKPSQEGDVCDTESSEFEGIVGLGVEAHAAEGSEFVDWTVEEGNGEAFGVCGESSVCIVTLGESEEIKIKATFSKPLENPSLLSVFKGGNGAGTVTSDPAGISCGTEPCSAEYEEGETIELIAAPASGSAFAGWLGCHPVAGDIDHCTVTLDGPMVDVTAVFMAEGAQGPQGPQGNPGSTGPQGPQGNPGSTGPQGNPGATGPQGPAGADGQNGAAGAQGAAGPQGPAGPQGERGPEGKVKVTCKVKGKKVKCTVKQAASTSRLHWRLMRGGHAVASGATASHEGRARLSLDAEGLQPGRYVLRVPGQKGVRIAIG